MMKLGLILSEMLVLTVQWVVTYLHQKNFRRTNIWNKNASCLSTSLIPDSSAKNFQLYSSFLSTSDHRLKVKEVKTALHFQFPLHQRKKDR